MNRGDLGFGLFIGGMAAGVVAIIAGVVYLVVSVAKWAWGA